MNQLVSVVVLGLLLLLIFSPFAALSLLLVVLFGATVFWMVTSLIGGMFSGSNEPRSPNSSQVAKDASE